MKKNINFNLKENFIELITPLKKELYYIASSKLNNKNDIDDIIQETILSAYKKINTLKDISNLKNWIITILLNKCNDYYRKEPHFITFSYEQNDSDASNILIDDYSDVHFNLDFNKLLLYLSNDEKTIFTLFYSEERTTKDISKLLNINENTVKTKLRRSKEKLKKIIERSIQDEKR